MSINRAVVYLWLGALLTILLGLGLMRWKLKAVPGTRQTFGEVIYDIAQTQVAETGLPTKAMSRWFPYVATIMLFIFVVNLLGFIPLPITGQTYHGVPGLGDLRRDLDDLGHARAGGDDLGLPAHRGHPLQRLRQVLPLLDPRRAEGPADPDRPDRDPLAVHAADQPVSPSLRQHAGGPHPDPDDDRPGLHHPHAAVARSSGCRPRSSSTSSKS